MNILSSITAQLQKQQEPKLLEHAKHNLVLANYGKKHKLKPNQNNRTVTFYRRAAADLTAAGAPTTLTEGGQTLTDRDLTYTAVDVSLTQYGQTARVSDIMSHIALLDFVKDNVALMGEEAALKADSIIRDQLSHPTTGLAKIYAQKLANFNALVGATNAAGRLLPSDILRAVTILENNRAPMINGKYVFIVPPAVASDILNNAEWREVIRNNDAEKYFKGVIGELFNAIIVKHTNPFREANTVDTEGTYAAAGTIYSCYALGAEAFGIVDMDSLGGSPFKPQIIILDKADKSDKLNQYINIGWKTYWGSAVLNATFGLTVRCKTEFAD